jgi:Xaa-Pro aminopeptidase
MATGWSAQPSQLPAEDEVAQFAARRRSALSEHFRGTTLVVGSGALKVRSNDTDYAFRPHSDFYWLTGSTEPDAVLVMTPDGTGHRSVLYVAGRSDRTTSAFYTDARYGELWVGPRDGVAETSAKLAIDCRSLTEFSSVAHQLSGFALAGSTEVALDVSKQDLDTSQQLQTQLSELRLIKDEFEIRQLKGAVGATIRGFNECIDELATASTHQRGERWLEGTFWRRSRLEGNDVGYNSIVACGSHATTLHWTANCGAVADGQLLLMDMGVESEHLYTADVTRTIPVGGAFSDPQRQVYDVVRRAQQAGIDAIRPGVPFLAAHQAAMEVCAQALSDWELLPVSVDESLSTDPTAIGAGLHRRYTLHGTSHMLGIDVHDCAEARNETYRAGNIAENMVFTVEPGLYFQANDETVPPELRGIGVRIEDDIVVTAEGCDNLSAALPRSIEDVEAWVQGAKV